MPYYRKGTTARGMTTKIKQQLVIAIAAAAVASGGVISALILGVGPNRSIQAYSCGDDKEIEYIIKSGNEFIIVNPTNKWSRNSFLVSSETPNVPKNWLFRGIPVKSFTSSGFQLEDKKPDRHIKLAEFNANSGVLTVNYSRSSLKTLSLTCKPTNAIPKLAASANNAPVEYLLLRQHNISLLNPRLGQKDFNLLLYDAIKSKEHSTYSVYSLLSSMPEGSLTGDQSLAMKEARDKLIEANSSNVDLWEYNNTGRYSWQFPNEKGEAERLSIAWCNSQQYANTGEYTSKGYKIIGSTPEIRSSDGFIRETYPDGRFAGYVNYTAECNGTNYKLRKTGGVDAEEENQSYG